MESRTLKCIAAIALIVAGVNCKSAQAQTLIVLHSFAGGDGANPNAGLIRDASGNLYGTTVRGGGHGAGELFKLATTGRLTVLHSFTGYPYDGANPVGGLILDASGNLYGTTSSGAAEGAAFVFYR